MITYKQLKDDNELLIEINGRQNEILETLNEIIKKRNEEIAKLKIENRYMTRKISEYENYLDRNKPLLVRFNNEKTNI